MNDTVIVERDLLTWLLGQYMYNTYTTVRTVEQIRQDLSCWDAFDQSLLTDDILLDAITWHNTWVLMHQQDVEDGLCD